MGSRTPGGLLAEITAQAPIKGPTCTMVAVEAALTPDDLAGLRTAYANPVIRHVAIFRALKARGLPVSESALTRHRKGECTCGRAGTG